MKRWSYSKLTLFLLLMIFTTLCASVAYAESMPGAIWTTDSLHQYVNNNVFYANKDEVYLNGGPLNKAEGHLPVGNYFVKITQPDGTILGSSIGTTEQNQVFVESGTFSNLQLSTFVFSASSNFTELGYDTTANPGGEYKVWLSQDPNFTADNSKTDNFKVKDNDNPASLHIIKFNDLNSNGVQDADESPIPGWVVTIKKTDEPPKEWTQVLEDGTWNGWVDPGTYEITEETRDGWVPTRPITATVELPVGGSGEVIFGNHQLTHLVVKKFNDINGNCAVDSGEPEIIGWKAVLTPASGTPMPITLPFSEWVEPGSYNIKEDTSDPAWVATKAPSQDIVLAPGDNNEVNFLNLKLPTLNVLKFYDPNRNKTQDQSEIGLPGWKVNISGTSIFGKSINQDIFTGTDGKWIDTIAPGTYTISEYMPADLNWFSTGDKIVTITIPAVWPPANPTVQFSNAYLGQGGGHTLGFWSNKNGFDLINTGKYLTYLGSLNPQLNLVNYKGTSIYALNYLTESNYSKGFRPWLLNATAENMSYMLSVQLTAMELNTLAGPNLGFVDKNSVIYIGTTLPVTINGNVVSVDGFVTINNLMSAANEAIGLSKVTLAGNLNRAYQEFLKTALDKANNNQSIYVLPKPPAGPYF